MNKYQATFRQKSTKKEVTQDTLAFNAQDAVIQCIVNLIGRGFLSSEYDLVGLGPHPDEVQVPMISMPQKVQ